MCCDICSCTQVHKADIESSSAQNCSAELFLTHEVSDIVIGSQRQICLLCSGLLPQEAPDVIAEKRKLLFPFFLPTVLSIW